MWLTEHTDLIFFNKGCMMQLLKDVIDDISGVTPLISSTVGWKQKPLEPLAWLSQLEIGRS